MTKRSTSKPLLSAFDSAFFSSCNKNSADFFGQRPCVVFHCLAYEHKIQLKLCRNAIMLGNDELPPPQKKMHGGMGRNMHTAILEIVISNTAEQITQHKYIHIYRVSQEERI